MPRRFIIDASVTLAWLFDEDQSGARIEPVLDGAELVAPALWPLEIVNVILVKERRKLLTEAQGTHLLELLEDWTVEIIGEPPREASLAWRRSLDPTNSPPTTRHISNWR